MVRIYEGLGTSLTVSRIRADEKKVAIGVQCDPDAVAALCDQKLVRQALINVLVNAIKFSPVQSEVRIAVEATESTVTIITTDAGPGFTEAGIREAFEPFWQDRSSLLSSGEGVGLGLAIAKRYVEAAGGSITIENSSQGGARVSIALKRSTNGRPSAPPE